jgi:hypothetical protein
MRLLHCRCSWDEGFACYLLFQLSQDVIEFLILAINDRL